MPGVS